MDRIIRFVSIGCCFLYSLNCMSWGLAQESDEFSFSRSSASEAAWYSGFDIVIAKPLYSSNVGLRESEQVNSQQFSIDNAEFDYDYQTSPRVWIGYQGSSAIGVRATWWQFANQANEISTAPSANGFGRVEHPSFGDVDISAITPTERMMANASLDVYAIDLELTRNAEIGAGTFLLSGGLRFASLDQSYNAVLLNSNSIAAGSIDYRQHVRGIGPTFSASTARNLTERWQWYALGRGSLLVGEGNERLEAGEDLDFVNPQRTTEVGRRDQLLPILDLQLGSTLALNRWGRFQPAIRGGWELSWWGDVGNNSGGASDLGFVGFALGLEGVW